MLTLSISQAIYSFDGLNNAEKSMADPLSVYWYYARNFFQFTDIYIIQQVASLVLNLTCTLPTSQSAW